MLTDGENEYLLFDGYVQIGRVYFMVHDGETPGIISMVSTFAGMYMEEYTFNEDGRLYKVSLFDTGGMNIVHSTIPWD